MMNSQIDQQVDLAADDIVPMMVYVIEESDVHDLLATSEYIMQFDFSNLKDRDLGQGFDYHYFILVSVLLLFKQL